MGRWMGANLCRIIMNLITFITHLTLFDNKDTITATPQPHTHHTALQGVHRELSADDV